MTKPHKIIFLQCTDAPLSDDSTWCADKIHDDDVEYVRKDLYDKLQTEIIAMRATLDAVGGAGWQDGEPTH